MDPQSLPLELSVQEARKIIQGRGTLPMQSNMDAGLPDELDFLTARKIFSTQGVRSAAATPTPTKQAHTHSHDPVNTQTSLGQVVAPTLLPLNGRITQGFGVPQAVKAAGEKTHAGIDIAVPVGTPIPAPISGRVLKVEQHQGGYGNSVLTLDEDGRIRRYSHLSNFKLQPGQTFKKGDVLALSGNTGASSGPHLDVREYVPNQ